MRFLRRRTLASATKTTLKPMRAAHASTIRMAVLPNKPRSDPATK